jgi:hypothetical protein
MSKEQHSDPAEEKRSSSNEITEESKLNEESTIESCDVCGTEVASWKADRNSGIRIVIR